MPHQFGECCLRFVSLSPFGISELTQLLNAPVFFERFHVEFRLPLDGPRTPTIRSQEIPETSRLLRDQIGEVRGLGGQVLPRMRKAGPKVRINFEHVDARV
jgi:hypothetical protein